MSGHSTFKQSMNLLVKSLQTPLPLKVKFSIDRNFLSLTKDFQSEVTTAVKSTKLQILEILQQHQLLDVSQEWFNADVQKSFKKLGSSILMLNRQIPYLLEEGILNIYMSLSELRERLETNMNTLVLQNLVKQITQALSSLLRKFFLFQEYKTIKKRQSEAYTYHLKYNEEFDKQNAESELNISETTVDKKVFAQIQNLMNSQSLQLLLDNYLKKEIDEIRYKEEKCRICSKKIKLEAIEKHVRLCKKNSKLKQRLSQTKVQSQELKEKAISLLQVLKQSSDKCPQNESLKKVITLFLREKLAEKEKITIRKRTDSAQYPSIEAVQKTKWQYHLFYHELKYKENELLTDIMRLEHKKQDIERQMGYVLSMIQSKELKENNLLSIKMSNCGSSTMKSSKSMKLTDCTASSKKSISVSHWFYQQDLHGEDYINQDQSKSDEKSTDNHSPSPLDDQNMLNFALKMKSFKTKQSLLRANSQSSENFQTKRFVSLQQISLEENRDDVSIQSFQILKVLGKGAFGKVYMARRKQTKDLYALKIIRLPENCSEMDLNNIATENNIFKKIAGDHLVTAPFSFSQKGCHIFVMQLMPGGDLRKLLGEQVYFEEEIAKFYLAEIVLAIQHLHSFDIIHRDLKPQNLVLDHEGYLKLTDYGLSAMKIEKKLERQRQFCLDVKREPAKRRHSKLFGLTQNNHDKVNLIGTPDYIAPEIINRISTDNKSIDWWSLGVMAYELLIGTRPFCSDTIEGILSNIEDFNIDWPEVDAEDGISSVAKDFIEQLLNKDYSKRLGANGAQEIKNHPFFKQIDWQNIRLQSPPFPPDMRKFNEEATAPQDTALKKEVQDRLQEYTNSSIKPRKLKLERFVRFDLLGTETIQTVEKIFTETSDRLKKLRSCQTFEIDQTEIKTRMKAPSISLTEDF